MVGEVLRWVPGEPAPDAEGIMATKSSYLIGGLAIAAVMVGALPAAQGIEPPTQRTPDIQVNRTAKGDRLAVPQTIAVKKARPKPRAISSRSPIRPASAGSWTAAIRCSAR